MISWWLNVRIKDRQHRQRLARSRLTQHHRTLCWFTPDSCAESSANLQGHPTRSTGSVQCSPDPCTKRVTKCPHSGRWALDSLQCVRCTPLTLVRPDSTPDAKGQRPLHPRSASGKHFRDFSKIPTGAIENMHLIFSKALNPASQARLEGERNPNPSLP